MEPPPPDRPPGGALDRTPGARPDAARPSEINALLGRGTRFEGKLFFEGRVRVDGAFRGEILGGDVLVVGDGAHVVGHVRVSSCIVTGGEVEADIEAHDAIELYAPAKVTGALHAPAIFIDRGVLFEGSCKMAPLDDDTTATEGVGVPVRGASAESAAGQDDDSASPQTWASGTRPSRPDDDP